MEERPVDNPLLYGPIIHLLNQRENDMSKNTRDTQSVSTKKIRPFPKHLDHINLYAAGINIGAALTGNYRAEHLFALKQSLELYDLFQEKIQACDDEIEKNMAKFATDSKVIDTPIKQLNPSKKKVSKNSPAFNLGRELHRLTGVDLLAVPGINHISALQLIGEIGLDMTQWKSAKQFASWLGLCPGNNVSGGKRLSGKTKPSNNRAAATLRMAAFTLYRSQTSLGAYLRRLKSHKGPMKAITATAHKLAKIIYNMLRHGVEYKEAGQTYYEEQYRDRIFKNLKRKAAEFGFNLVESKQLIEIKNV